MAGVARRRGATVFVADKADLMAIHLANATECPQGAVTEVALCAQLFGVFAMWKDDGSAS